MTTYDYRTFSMESVRERDIELDVGPTFDEWQEEGYEYVSGPSVTHHADGHATYVFLIRKRRGGKLLSE